MNAIAAKIRRTIGVVGDPLLALMLVAFGFVSLATADDVEALRVPTHSHTCSQLRWPRPWQCAEGGRSRSLARFSWP